MSISHSTVSVQPVIPESSPALRIQFSTLRPLQYCPREYLGDAVTFADSKDATGGAELRCGSFFVDINPEVDGATISCPVWRHEGFDSENHLFNTVVGNTAPAHAHKGKKIGSRGIAILILRNWQFTTTAVNDRAHIRLGAFEEAK